MPRGDKSILRKQIRGTDVGRETEDTSPRRLYRKKDLGGNIKEKREARSRSTKNIKEKKKVQGMTNLL